MNDEQGQDSQESKDFPYDQMQLDLGEQGWPLTLIRAAAGEASRFVVRLRTGEVVHFTRAQHQGITPGWVKLLKPIVNSSEPDVVKTGLAQELEVRLSDIVWVLEDVRPSKG